jgi:hypothetical protein
MRDAQLYFSTEQAITADANSENVLKLAELHASNTQFQMANQGLGVLIEVTTTFDTAAEDGTLDISFQTDALAAFGSATTLFSLPQFAEATLVDGYKYWMPLPAGAYEAHARLNYNVGGAGNFTAGALNACICPMPDDWFAYANNQPTGGY